MRRSVKKPYLDSDRFRKGVCRTSAEEEEGDANSKYLGTPSVDAGDDYGVDGTPKAQRKINFSHQHSH